METLAIDNRMFSLVVLYDIHTKFYLSALEGITDEDAHNRLNTKANHIAWLAGSLLSERYELANAFGEKLPQPHDLFKDHKGIQDGVTYPSLSQYKDDWQKISPILRERLMHADTEKLDSTFEMMPGDTMSFFDLVSFMTYREANCIGQIALWRRLLGYDAMKYM